MRLKEIRQVWKGVRKLCFICYYPEYRLSAEIKNKSGRGRHAIKVMIEIWTHDFSVRVMHVSVRLAFNSKHSTFWKVVGWNPAECFFSSLFAASTPAPQQSSSSDCPPSQASDPPTDHLPVDPEGSSSNAREEEQSVRPRVASQVDNIHGSDLTNDWHDAIIHYRRTGDLLLTKSRVIAAGRMSCD